MNPTSVSKKQRAPLPPTRFAFGGGTKTISELMFNKYDLDKNGSISRDELRSLCYDMGYYLSDAELAWACTVIDKDGSGTIDYREFADWWKTSSRFEHLKMPNAEQTAILCHIAQIFRSYDAGNQGTLDKMQFKAMCNDLIRHGILDGNGHQACQFEEIDRSHDGRINFNELIAWFKDVGVLEKMGISSP